MTRSQIVEEPDGTVTEYDEIDVAGDRVERLLREIFTAHWARVTVGPVVEGAAWELRFTAEPALSMMDGYLTVEIGAGHVHLCVGEPRAARPELARARRVARAAFFRSTGGACVAESYGLRLWNGRGEQMITVFFPNPFYDDAGRPLATPDRARTALWEDLRRRYCA